MHNFDSDADGVLITSCGMQAYLAVLCAARDAGAAVDWPSLAHVYFECNSLTKEFKSAYDERLPAAPSARLTFAELGTSYFLRKAAKGSARRAPEALQVLDITYAGATASREDLRDAVCVWGSLTKLYQCGDDVGAGGFLLLRSGEHPPQSVGWFLKQSARAGLYDISDVDAAHFLKYDQAQVIAYQTAIHALNDALYTALTDLAKTGPSTFRVYSAERPRCFVVLETPVVFADGQARKARFTEEHIRRALKSIGLDERESFGFKGKMTFSFIDKNGKTSVRICACPTKPWGRSDRHEQDDLKIVRDTAATVVSALSNLSEFGEGSVGGAAGAIDEGPRCAPLGKHYFRFWADQRDPHTVTLASSRLAARAFLTMMNSKRIEVVDSAGSIPTNFKERTAVRLLERTDQLPHPKRRTRNVTGIYARNGNGNEVALVILDEPMCPNGWRHLIRAVAASGDNAAQWHDVSFK